ncbi:MAG: MOSC domain-containing protein [Actinomycetota bacterium]|nr:MOSC domain-containing protein [Actinomycetota bacterium]
MRLLSVNVGDETSIEGAGKSGKTGIYKHPVRGPLEVLSGGLAGDTISDKENHGGSDQAVYVFGAPDYEWWSETLGRDLPPGTFGENLTVSDLESAQVCVGDRLGIGSVLLEVTAPRIPCLTLAVRMGDPAFVKRFRRVERPGVYCRVVREGEVRADDSVVYTPYAGERVPVLEVFRAFFEGNLGEEALRRQLSVPIAARARRAYEEQLAELSAEHTRMGSVS